MKIALINGSPKFKDSASGILALHFKRLAGDKCECIEIKMNKPELTDEAISILGKCDTWIFFYPLYVDGVPGHLLSCLKTIEKHKEQFGKIAVYAVSNCGFHDGKQCEWSLDVIRHWSRRTGLVFCGGIGLGGGGAVPEVNNMPISGILMSTYNKALKALLEHAIARTGFDNFYASINMPRFFFKRAAEYGWGRKLKMNGKKRKDIANIP